MNGMQLQNINKLIRLMNIFLVMNTFKLYILSVVQDLVILTESNVKCMFICILVGNFVKEKYKLIQNIFCSIIYFYFYETGVLTALPRKSLNHQLTR